MNHKYNLTCLDNDIKLVSKNKSKHNLNLNINYGLFDFTKTKDNQIEVFGNILNMYNDNIYTKYDTIIMLNTVHNAFNTVDEKNNMISNIDLFSKPDSILIIRYLDYNLLNNLFIDNELIIHSNGSYIRKLYNNKIKIYFNWCHNNPLEEYVVSGDALIKAFDNWDVIFEEDKKIFNSDPWENYFNCFKTIIFKKT